MKVVLQRVSRACVRVEGEVVGEIGRGALLLVGIEKGDREAEVEALAERIALLRFFQDESGRMNRSLAEVGGAALVVSQFTLHARTKKGTRPSFDRAARPEVAIPLYERFVTELSAGLGKPVATGEFGAMMKVALVNDGPVTILLDSRVRE